MKLNFSARPTPFMSATNGAVAATTNAALQKARAAVNDADQNPMIVKLAPVPLAHAHEMLARAEAACKAGKDSVDVEHLAYMARRQAWMAEARARIAAGEKGVSFGNERNDAREREIARISENLAPQGEASPGTDSRAEKFNHLPEDVR